MVEFVLGQPSLHERGFERIECLLTVGPRRDHVAAAIPGCGYLASRLDQLGTSPDSDLRKA
jgi:hypothetical protein